MRRINLIGQATDHSEKSSDWDEDNVVLGLDSNGAASFVLNERMNEQPFSTMIVSGSRITKFARENVSSFLKSDLIFARPLQKNK